MRFSLAMTRPKATVIAIAAIAVGMACAHMLIETNKTKAHSWEELPYLLESAGGPVTWENMKEHLKYMPPLEPGTQGVKLEDGTFIPRVYFDMPPPVRFAVPVQRQ